MKNSLDMLLSDSHALEMLASRFNINHHADAAELLLECKTKGIDADFFIELLSVFEGSKQLPVLQLRTFPIPVIIDYLKRTHTYYLNKRLPEIEQSLAQLEINLERGDDLLSYLIQFFTEFKHKLAQHIAHEERVLFPYAIHIWATRNTRPLPDALEGFSAQVFINEHNSHIEDMLSQVKKYIISFHSHVDQLSAYRILLHQLSNFETDLTIHAAVEDDVLIPLLQQLELRT